MNCERKNKIIAVRKSTVKPLISGHPRDLSSCPFDRGCPVNVFVFLLFFFAVIKFLVVNQAILNSRSLPTSMFLRL